MSFKIGVLLPEGTADLLAALERAAAWGASGVQFYARNCHYDLLDAPDSRIDEVRRRMATLGVAPAAVCGELGGHGFQIAAENPAKIAATKRIIDIAERLGATVVTTHIGVIPADCASPVYQEMVRAMTDLGRYATAHGIQLAIETGPEMPLVLRGFLERTDGGVGANLDPANLVMVQRCNAAQSARELAGWIVHTHAKDGVNCRPCEPQAVYDAFAEGGFANLVARTGELFRETPLGEGDVDFPSYLAALREVGYNGFLTIERETGADPEADIRKAVGFLKAMI